MKMTCRFNSSCILKSDLINQIVMEEKKLHGIDEFCNIEVNNFYNIFGFGASAQRISRFDSLDIINTI